MADMFHHIFQGYKAAQIATELAGRALGLKWGIVTDDIDPDGQGRIKVYLGHQGGHNKSNWLIRIMPWKHLSVPVPEPGDVVLVGFNDANQNEVGFYLGFAQNLMNPAGLVDEWRYQWDSFMALVAPNAELEKVVLEFNGIYIKFYEESIKIGYDTSAITFAKTYIDITTPMLTFGGTEGLGICQITPDTINFTAPNVLIDQIPVTVIGAVDSDGDTLVTDGR